MNPTFTIDEDIIRRLQLQQKQSELAPARRRFPVHLLWHAQPTAKRENTSWVPRPRWS